MVLKKASSRWVGALLSAGLVLAGLSGCQSTNSPAQPFSVGSSAIFIHDESRPFDAVAGVDSGVRTLITEIWYPASQEGLTSARRATYGDYSFGDRGIHQRMMTETSFYHLTEASVREGVDAEQIDSAIAELFDRPRDSYVDVAAAETSEPFPVVVMTHGDAGSRYNMQTVCEYLAAHGYIVIAAEHTGNSPFSLIGRDPALQAVGGDPELREAMAPVLELLDDSGAYAHEAKWGQSYTPDGSTLMTPAGLISFDASVVERVNDLRAVLKQLEALNQQGILKGKVDLERIGLMGRSFGGATTLAGLALEDQFKAGVAVVPPYLPDLRAALPAQLLHPAGVESAILSSEKASVFSQLHKPTLLLSGAEDKIIIEVGQALASTAGAPVPTPANPHPMLRHLFEQTQLPAIWGLLPETNHASLGVAGPYWWPELKPNQFDRVLEPQQRYELMDSAMAHKIQKEKTLQFFDRFVKQDESVQELLKNNSFAETGLEWQVKNF